MEQPPSAYVAPRLRAGLGNRLFSFAAAQGAAEKWNLPLRFLGINEIWDNEHGDARRILSLYPHIPYIDQDPRPYITYEEGPHQLFTYHPFYDSALRNDCPNLICGYRINPQYFPKQTSVLKPDWCNALGAETCLQIAETAGLSDKEEQERTFFIHFRHGDYDTLPHHQTNIIPYYMRAASMLPSGARLHCFSDEPHKCTEKVESIRDVFEGPITWSTQTGDVEALYEMSLCRGGGIVANSTFSWWGAYFSKLAGGLGPYTFPSQWGIGLPNAEGTVPEWGIGIQVCL